MKAKWLLAAAAAAIAWMLKRHYADAGVEDLQWILAPTAWLAGAITNTTFTMQPAEGYLSRERLFLIEKSCAGLNFLIAAFGLITVARLHRAASPATAVRFLAAGLVIAYAAAIVVNATRISIAMWLAGHPVAILSAADVHRLEGIVVYFGGLLLLYEAMQRLDRGLPSEGR